MIDYLEQIYFMHGLKNLTKILELMKILNNGIPLNRKIWQEWLAAIDRAKNASK